MCPTIIKKGVSNLFEQFRGIPTGNICDSNDREGAMDPAIQPLHPRMELVGTALPVECVPGDNLAIHIAVAQAKPGDVLVINGGGMVPAGLFGELLATSCISHGIIGVVIDGCCRDKNELIEMGFPVFVRGISPNGTTKDTWVSVNSPILCGGRMVRPGDIIIGDCDGVVVLPHEKAQVVLEKSKDKKKAEEELRMKLADGALTLDLLSLRNKI
jgi:4-hydroxy-4-methyl-2-oxoglutarate aldolase